MSHMP